MDPSAYESLSAQQRACLQHVWGRLSSKEIALQLGISKNTVDGYIAEAVARLGARDRREAARLCFGDAAPGRMVDSPPDRVGGDAARVASVEAIAVPARDGTPGRSTSWQRWVPFRTGAHNDLYFLARPLWIVGIASLAAVGFGAFASGVHLINDLFR